MDWNARTHTYSQIKSYVKLPHQYNQIKDLLDYLDQDKQSLLRDPKTQPSGLINLGNTCYLNVLLQILYHINHLREKVFLRENQNNKFLKSLRRLFGTMCRSKFAYSDPSEVLRALQDSHPDIFVAGVQNDFAEVFSILVQELNKGFQDFSDDQKKSLIKIFQGKNRALIKADKVIHKQSKFNVINLSCSEGSFDKALNAFKRYQIDEFIGSDKKVMKAVVEIQFPQTPALMIFYINRVTYVKGEPVKDLRNFEFQNKIYISKKRVNTTCTLQQKSKYIQNQRQKLQQWLQAQQIILTHLKQTLSYLESKEDFIDINQPLIQNSFGQQSLQTTKQYLLNQIQKIQQKIGQVQKQIIQIQTCSDKLAQESDSELYILYALMIHVGKSARSGHYKTIINTQENQWFEFDDKNVKELKQSKIEEYKKNGEVCCLFYRRSSLICNSSKVTLSASLKQQVIEYDNLLKDKIDKARVIQYRLRAEEHAQQMLQYQYQFANENSHFYFFKPILYLISQKKSSEVIKQAIMAEYLQNEQSISNIKKELFYQNHKIDFPVSKFDFSKQYLDISKRLKTILIKQRDFNQIVSCYEDLLFLAKLKVNDQNMKCQLKKVIAIIFMKGVFYYQMSVQFQFLITQKLSKLLYQIMDVMNQESDFLFEYMTVITKINDGKYKTHNTNILTHPKNPLIIQSISDSDLFFKRFSHWIKRYQNIKSVNCSIIESDRRLQNDYIDNEAQ